MTVLNAHFDGKVFVPDTPPRDLRPGFVTLEVVEVGMDVHPLTHLPVIHPPEGARTITSDDVRQAMEEGD